MWRSIASNFLTLALVILVAAAGVVAWGKRQYAGPGPLGEPVCFRVEQGWSMRKVSDGLEGAGAISSGYIFRVGADYAEKSDKVKYGSYLIPAGASMAEIVEAVTRGGQSTCGTQVNFRIGVAGADILVRELDPATGRYEEIAKFDPAAGAAPQEYLEVAQRPDVRFGVTLVEGATAWQVVEGLKQADFLAGEIAGIPPEGTLAPDSYDVSRGADRAGLIAEMTARQSATLAELWEGRADDLPYATPQEALIMASLVEKETGIPEERPLVASVFVNRLRAGIRLQTDPAVIYGVTKGKGVLGRGLRQSELRAATPYNTYAIDGLPPTPIANPGRDAIEAALHPATTDYIYFVADGTGGHAFATSLAEHNANVAKWRAIEAEQQKSQGGSGN